MARPRRHPRNAQPLEQIVHAALAVAYAEPLLDERAEIDQSPSTNPVPLRVGSFQDRRHEGGLLAVGETLTGTRASPIVQTGQAFRVVPDYRVPQRLTLHAGEPSGLRPAHPFQRVGDGDHPCRRPAIALPPGQKP
jgi:hypothetical protein